jgi:hypothetical protein
MRHISTPVLKAGIKNITHIKEYRFDLGQYEEGNKMINKVVIIMGYRNSFTNLYVHNC